MPVVVIAVMITVVVVVVVVVVMNGSRRVASESESRLRRASKEIPEIAFARISERIPTKHSPKAELSFPGLRLSIERRKGWRGRRRRNHPRRRWWGRRRRRAKKVAWGRCVVVGSFAPKQLEFVYMMRAIVIL